MPELPEVETVRRYLESEILGKTIQGIEVYREKNIITDYSSFVNEIIGKRIIKLGRKGKFLIISLEDDLAILSHLRMEGKFFFYEKKEEKGKHDILRFDFSDGSNLVYNDTRKFGILGLYHGKELYEDSPLNKLGPDPFDCDLDTVYKKMHSSNKPAKELLLDQTIMAGNGNIYADECLFASNIHPLTKGKDLSKAEVDALIKSSIRILNEAITLGGSTIKTYHPSLGVDGRMQNSLLAYGRKGEPCLRCGAKMHTIFVGGRSSTYCPFCQHHRSRPLVIAIAGPIHSGKSYASNFLAKKGLPLFDSDKEIKKLYQNEKVIEGIGKIAGKDVLEGNSLNLDSLRKKMEEKKIREKVTAFVYPLLRKEAISFIDEHKGIVLMEVPLLLGSGMEDLVDILLFVNAPEEIRLGRLQKEGKDAESLMKVNASYPIKKYEKEATRVIVNASSFADFETELDSFIGDINKRLD